MKSLLIKILRAGNALVGPFLERGVGVLVGTMHGPESPIFIIGPPRSGSTLMFQIVTSAFDVGYISNCQCRLSGAPALVALLRRKTSAQAGSDFSSNYGRTGAPEGPSECGEWWYRFFPRDPVYVTTEDISDKDLSAFRRSCQVLRGAIGRPLVFKNTYVSMRIDPIVAAFPNAIFVRLTRDRFGNASSILKARKSVTGSYDTWWSLPPREVDALRDLPADQQVVGQIDAINRQIDADISRLGLEEQVFVQTYDDMCDDPEGFCTRLQNYAADRGVALGRRSTPLTPFVPSSGGGGLPAELTAALRNTLAETSSP